MNKKNSLMALGLILLTAPACAANDKDISRESLKASSSEPSSSSSSPRMVGSGDAEGILVVKAMPPQLMRDEVTFKLFFDRTRIYMSKGSLSDEIQLTIPQDVIEAKKLMGAPMHYTVTHDRTNSVEAYGECKMPVGMKLKSGMVFKVTIDGRKLTKKSLEGFDVLIPDCTVTTVKEKQ